MERFVTRLALLVSCFSFQSQQPGQGLLTLVCRVVDCFVKLKSLFQRMKAIWESEKLFQAGKLLEVYQRPGMLVHGLDLHQMPRLGNHRHPSSLAKM